MINPSIFLQSSFSTPLYPVNYTMTPFSLSCQEDHSPRGTQASSSVVVFPVFYQHNLWFVRFQILTLISMSRDWLVVVLDPWVHRMPCEWLAYSFREASCSDMKLWSLPSGAPGAERWGHTRGALLERKALRRATFTPKTSLQMEWRCCST